MELTAAGLKSPPFQAHGAPATFVTYSSQKSATRFLDKTRTNKCGMGLIEGPSLSGKTTIIREFIRTSFTGDHAVALIDGTAMDEAALMQDILDQFGYAANFDSANERFNMVRVLATQQATNGNVPFIALENLHALEAGGLVALCELAALKVEDRSAIRMVLTSDQPMMPMIRKPAMKPLLSRLTGEFHLKPMEFRETRKYIKQKLIGAGCKNPDDVLPQEISDRLHVESGGLPGAVDRLAAIALSKAKSFPVQVDDVPHKGGTGTPGDVPALHRQAEVVAEEQLDESLPRLIVSFDGKTVARTEVNKARFMIGRSQHNDLSLDHEYISRQHAVLVRIGNATVLLDLKSRNETFVNGKRIDNQVLINDDIISIGDHRIKFLDPAFTQREKTPKEANDPTTIAKALRETTRNLLKVVGNG